ncbi:MAG: PKD domain-containing protein [Williamsia sp.]|nr:PKD domain-containing protein [Williamsia sp.]
MPKPHLCNLITLFLSSCIFFADAQTISVSYGSLPNHLQFFARDNQDSSVVLVNGVISSTGYDSIYLKLYKSVGASRTLVKVVSSGMLSYNGGMASFTLSPKIHAELAEYSIEMYAAQGAQSLMLRDPIDSLVCGDAFLVAGQSNSHPARQEATYLNEFCRTLGIQTGDQNYNSYDAKDTLWNYATGYGGYGDYTGPYLVGAWGIRLMQFIKETYSIPVCIINGGAGGSSISENLPSGSHQDLSKIYDKLLYRAKKAKLQDHIKAIFWYQGEANDDSLGDTTTYSGRFSTLYNAWKSDYSPVSKIYVMQLHHGCSTQENIGGLLREFQRTLKVKYTDIETVSTMNLPGHDDCHYTITGYDTLSYRLFRILARDLYGSPATPEISSPDIAHVYYANQSATSVRLLFNNTSNLSLTSNPNYNIKDYFYLDGASNKVAQVRAQGNIVTLDLLTPSANAASLTYLPNIYYNNTTTVYQGPYIINSSNVGALTFYGKAIENNTAYAAPEANFTYNASQAFVSVPISLTDLSLEWPTTYSWQSQDGGILSSTSSANPTITYNTTGIHQITLTVTNAFGSSVITKQIIIPSAGEPPYLGGVGRGETMGYSASQPLTSDPAASAYLGGSGRGEVMALVTSQSLSTNADVEIYHGGIGRGEAMTYVSNQSLSSEQLNSKIPILGSLMTKEENSVEQGSLMAYPNPVHPLSTITIKYIADGNKGSATLILTDERGITVWKNNMSIKAGTNTAAIPRFVVQNGNYYIQIVGSKWRSVARKIIVGR